MSWNELAAEWSVRIEEALEVERKRRAQQLEDQLHWQGAAFTMQPRRAAGFEWEEKRGGGAAPQSGAAGQPKTAVKVRGKPATNKPPRQTGRKASPPGQASPGATVSRTSSGPGVRRPRFPGDELLAVAAGRPDDERRGGGGARPDSGFTQARSFEASLAAAGAGGAAGNASKALVSDGYRPAVIKLVSFAHGGRRAGATAKYVQRDEVALETDDMRLLANHEEVQAEVDRWSADFDKRRESEDVTTARLQIAGLKDTPADRATLHHGVEAAFDGHRHAWRVEVRADGSIEARAVVAMAGELERFRTGQGKAPTLDLKSLRAIKKRMDLDGISQERVSLSIGKPGHGVEAVAWRLSKLVEQGGVTSDLKPVEDRLAARNLARDWKPTLRSLKPRDTMHLVVSSKADVDRGAFAEAVRGFLHKEFANHKFMWGVHEDKGGEGQTGHIHAHVIVAMKGLDGQRLHPNVQDFKAWRELFAHEAQSQGLKIAASPARERASSQSYGAKDKAIVDAADHPRPGREELDRAYARANENLVTRARHRMNVAKANPIRFAVTERQRKVANSDLAEWSRMATTNPQNAVAKDNVIRLSEALAAGAVIRDLLMVVRGDFDMASAQKMNETMHRMYDTVQKAAEGMSGPTREQFEARAMKVLSGFAVRVDLQRLSERGIEKITTEEAARIASIAGGRLAERARETAGRERREAEAARRTEDAVLAEHMKPSSLSETESRNDNLAEATKSAHRETREAQAAAKAARDLQTNPGAKLNPEAVQGSDHMKELKLDQDRALNEIRAAVKKDGQRSKPMKR